MRMKILLAFFALASPAMAATAPVQTLNLTNYHVTFNDNFIDLHTIADDPGSTLGSGNLWVTGGWFSFSKFGGKTTNFAAGGADGPGLHIYVHKVGPLTWDWQGGIISTCQTKTAAGTYPGWRGFTTGYVEFEAKLPVSNGNTSTGDGVWPALWADSYGTNLATQGGTELDILEFYGTAPYDHYWETFHYTEIQPSGGIPGCHSSITTHILNPLGVDQSAGFHRYGIMIEDPKFVTAPAVPMIIGYFDGYEVWRQPERAEYRLPKCLLVDYAIGQFLPTGVIEGSHLDVHYVKVYSHN
jgi:Glycosyl hydrolases family 16